MDRYQVGRHSSASFNEDMEAIRSKLLEMGGLVEEQVQDALHGLLNADSALLEQVHGREDRVDMLEMEIDELCARVLALRQPAATDLRMLIAVSKSVSDLERIGDEAAKIASMGLKLAEHGAPGSGFMEARHIGTLVRQVLNEALDAFARFDADRAVEVVAMDEQIDAEYRSAMRTLVTFMMEDPRSISAVLNVIWALRSLERIGDHSRNICEQLVYLVKGKDVRHATVDQMEQVLRGK